MSDVIFLSIRIAAISTIITLFLSLIIAHELRNRRFMGKELLEAILILPMVLPPSVTGFVLLKVLGKNGVIGKLLFDGFGIRILFTWQSAVIAAAVVSFPLMYQSCKAAFISVDRTMENVARTLGAKEWTVFWRITMPMAFPSIISGIVLAFARALGEFGATLMLGGNIAGETRTIPIAIFFANEAGNQTMAAHLTWGVILYGLLVIYALNHWVRIQNVQEGDRND